MRRWSWTVCLRWFVLTAPSNQRMNMNILFYVWFSVSSIQPGIHKVVAEVCHLAILCCRVLANESDLLLNMNLIFRVLCTVRARTEYMGTAALLVPHFVTPHVLNGWATHFTNNDLWNSEVKHKVGVVISRCWRIDKGPIINKPNGRDNYHGSMVLWKCWENNITLSWFLTFRNKVEKLLSLF